MKATMRRIPAWFLAVVLACLTSVGLAVGGAAPASAAYAGNVWVNFGSGNCPYGGSVRGIYWAVDNFSSGPAEGDWGDSVIYPRVRIGASNTLSYQLYCKAWFGTYRSVVSQRAFTPSYNGQSYTF